MFVVYCRLGRSFYYLFKRNHDGLIEYVVDRTAQSAGTDQTGNQETRATGFDQSA
jgi:hypothetical protein